MQGPGGPGSDHGGPGGHETVVTGATADKIKAAALQAYPGATVSKTEKRDNGTYEAELTTKAGSEVHVSLDANFKVMADRGHHFGDGRWGGHFRRGNGGYPQGVAPAGGPSA